MLSALMSPRSTFSRSFSTSLCILGLRRSPELVLSVVKIAERFTVYGAELVVLVRDRTASIAQTLQLRLYSLDQPRQFLRPCGFTRHCCSPAPAKHRPWALTKPWAGHHRSRFRGSPLGRGK